MNVHSANEELQIIQRRNVPALKTPVQAPIPKVSPILIAELTEDLLRLDLIIASVQMLDAWNLSHDTKVGEDCKRMMITMAHLCRRTVQTKLRAEYVRAGEYQ